MIIKKIDQNMSILSLIVIGYLCVLIFGAVQGRYKSLIMPLMCILAAYGFTHVKQGLSNIIINIYNNKSLMYKNKGR